MINKASRSEIREKKHRRLRHHLNGTATTPRLAVFRSNKHIYAQIIDDTVGKTLVSASTLQKEVRAELENTDDVAAAAHLGTVIGKKAVEAGIESVVFDRGGYIYHGKVKALADVRKIATRSDIAITSFNLCVMMMIDFPCFFMFFKTANSFSVS